VHPLAGNNAVLFAAGTNNGVGRRFFSHGSH
jgi:hypothetical protein